jgi:hypothetical protein
MTKRQTNENDKTIRTFFLMVFLLNPIRESFLIAKIATMPPSLGISYHNGNCAFAMVMPASSKGVSPY